MLLSEIVNTLDEALKPEIAYEWDNVGLLVGDLNLNISKIMVVLELNKKTFEEAKEKSIDLIITHHPIIFKPLKKITSRDEKSEIIMDCIKNNIGIYTAHTNFDMIENGLNDYIANLLELQNQKILSYETSLEYGIGRVGSLNNDMTIEEFSNYVMEKLKLSDIRAVYGGGKIIKKVAVVNGSGIDYINNAKKSDFDVYITGDVKYHEAHDIKERGMNVIDAGHYGTEKHFNEAITNFLKDKLPSEIEFSKSNSMEDPFLVIKS